MEGKGVLGIIQRCNICSAYHLHIFHGALVKSVGGICRIGSEEDRGKEKLLTQLWRLHIAFQ